MSNVTRTPTKTITIPTTFINTSTTGANQLVAAAPGFSIRVIQAVITTTLANTVKFQSSTNDISSLMTLSASGNLVLPFNEHGWFQTNVGEALNLNISVATATGLTISYITL